MRICALSYAFLFLTGCWKTVAPTGLAVVGGGIGSIAGPVGGAIGAGGGAALGQIIKSEGEVDEVKEQVKALTSGDVGKLIELQASKQSSTFDKVVAGIYRVLWLLGISMTLWFIVPWVWAKHHVKKTVQKHINDNGQTKSSS